uniref:WD40 repeat n=1 Tax=Candidatus Kentrum sp. FW TaxID=2126338 RepID=A0A450TVX9_9GAMM|nr:MAG: WD40 repeat [Candidatus Kentron sp. FW]
MKKSPLYPWLLVFALLLSPPAQALDAEPQLVIDSGGHKAMIRDVIFTPDGRQLISVSEDKTIRIWDTGSGELVRTLRGQTGAGHEGKLFAGALSPDGRWLAMGGKTGNPNDRWIRLIDLKAPPDAPVRLLKGHTNVIQGLAFSPDGQRILSGSSDKTARLWDTKTGKTIEILRGHRERIYAVAFSSPDKKGGERLVTGSWDHTLRLWDGDGNSVKVLAGHTDKVLAAAFTPDGRYLLSGSWDQTIRLWDGWDGKFIKVLAKTNRSILSLSISSDGTKVITGIGDKGSGGNESDVFAIPSGQRLRRFTEHENVVIATAISPPDDQGRQLAATGGGSDNEIYLWDLENRKVRHKLVGKGNPIWSVGFARDGGSLAWGNENTRYVFLDKGPLQQRFQLHRAAGWPGSITPESSAPGASPQDDNKINKGFDPTWGGRVTDESRYLRAIQQVGNTRIRTANGQIHPQLEILQDGRVTHTITRGPTDGYRHRSLTLTPDGRTVISGAGNGVLTSFDVATGKKRQEFIGHTGDVWAVAPSPDGRFLVSGSHDQTVRLWELATGKALLTIFPASDGEWVAWTPEGYYTASLNGDRLIGWHINQGENKLARYYPAERFAGRFRKPRVVAKYLATGGDIDQAIRLANLELPRRERITRTDMADIPDIAPPMVFIREPDASRSTVHGPRLPLIAEARSFNQAGVKEIWVTVNGRAPGEGAAQSFRNTREARLETSLELEPGENRIAVYARNRHANSGPRLLVVTRQDPKPTPDRKPNLYLLAIGVSDYAEGGDGLDLQYADDDARAMARMLKAQEGRLYGKVESLILTDGQADRGGVLKGLKWLRRESTQRDTSVIFVAGHGIEDEFREYYFLPADADPEEPDIQGVKWLEFNNTLQNLPGIRWLLVDTCHSGGVTGKGARGVRRPDITEALSELKQAAGSVVIMSASTGGEQSLEGSQWRHGDSPGHGAFTKAIIDGLEQGLADQPPPDRMVYLHELNGYVTRRVKELTDGRQHPMTELPGMTRDFPVGIVE